MSAVKMYDVGPPELSTQRITEEFHFDNTSLNDLALTRRSREWSSEEKLAILRDFLKRKYGL
jgi:hypothetical protein